MHHKSLYPVLRTGIGIAMPSRKWYRERRQGSFICCSICYRTYDRGRESHRQPKEYIYFLDKAFLRILEGSRAHGANFIQKHILQSIRPVFPP